MSEEVSVLLQQIRDNQREAIALQREHMALYMKQLERVERINDRAEAIQGHAGKAMKFVLWLLVPLALLLILFAFWPQIRWLAWWATQ